MKARIVFLTSLLAASLAQAADLVVITHPAAGALTKDQVADLFLG